MTEFLPFYYYYYFSPMFNAKQSLYRERHTRWRRYVVTDRYDGGALEGKTYNLAIDNKGEGGLTAILDHYDYLYMSIDCCFVFPMPKSLFSFFFGFFTTI
jgi:hypothetical protein